MRKVTVLFFLFTAAAANAQTNDTSGKLDVFSSLGLSVVDKDYTPVSGNSVQTTTGFELRLSRQLRLGAALGFDSYGYKKSGTGYNLDGTLKLTGLGAFFRYKFGTGGLQPYLKAGGGTAWLSLPVVTVAQSTTNIEKGSQNVGMVLAEVGVQVRLLSKFSVLIGAEQKWLGKSTLADNASLRTTSYRIGMISSF